MFAQEGITFAPYGLSLFLQQLECTLALPWLDKEDLI